MTEEKKQPQVAGELGLKRIAFVALIPRIKGAVIAGHPVAKIFRDYDVAQLMSYPHFARYVARYLPDESRVHRSRRVQL